MNTHINLAPKGTTEEPEQLLKLAQQLGLDPNKVDLNSPFWRRGLRSIARRLHESSEMAREFALRGMEERAERGVCPFRAPLGYLNKDGQVVVDAHRERSVRHIFRLDAQGHTPAQIATIVTKKGLKSRSGRALKAAAITRMLRNPFYRGHFEFRGKRYEGTHTKLG